MAAPPRYPRSAAALAATLALVLSGCYTYTPVIGEPPAPGDEVQLRLSTGAAVELSERVGQPVRSVRGEVLGADDNSLRVSVRWGAIYAGTPFEGRQDTISFREEDVVEIDRRELSWTRTGLLAAGTVAGVAILFGSLEGGNGAPGPDDGEPPSF